jgi:general secretion pathway protein L
MTLLHDIAAVVTRWIDCVAASMIAAAGWFVSRRTVQFLEEEDCVFAVRASKDDKPAGDRVRFADGSIVGELPPGLTKAIRGNRVEIVLRPSRFLFRPLELPRRAVEFLDGIVRAQIDRLTPWTAGEAVFGWGRPAELANDRISIMIAATGRAAVKPLLQAAAELGPASVTLLTEPVDSADGGARIKVYEQNVRGLVDARRVSRGLLAVLVAAAAACVLAIGADLIIGGNLDAQQFELARRIADRRVMLRAGQDQLARSATALLDQRKRDTPAAVIVLEALSQVLPDHTYVTELRVEGSKLQVVGVTRDAPELIRLIEQSPHFTRATFFAPTTRAPSDPGERFHIEAHIEPVNAPRT